MNPNDAEKWWQVPWGTPVPVAYQGAINLQVALLLLYRWDEKNNIIMDQRTNVSMAAAARAMGTTVYKLKKLIETFREKGFNGVRFMNMPQKKNTRHLNVTLEQIDHICSRETLRLQATKTLLERAAEFNRLWSGQGCNLTAKDISDFYKGSGITLQRYATEIGPPKRDAAKIEEQARTCRGSTPHP